MSVRTLVIGGSGEISGACVEALAQSGHDVTVFNRGRRNEQPPAGVNWIEGDLRDKKIYARLAAREFDVVCQFLAFEPEDIQRDVDLFSGQCGQYVFISSASAYQKPWTAGVITEDTPLDNPFMAYSRNKAACEDRLMEAHASGQISATVVRPSHTYRERLPSSVIDGNHLAWRIRAGKAVPLHDDGESLWALTRSEDFAAAFSSLCGNAAAAGERYHITDDQSHTWNDIYRAIAVVAGCEMDVCHVRADVLCGYQEAWRGPLLGDKANSVKFDNSKIATLTGGWRCRMTLQDGLARAYECVRHRLDAGYQPPAEVDDLIDRIVSEQRRENER